MNPSKNPGHEIKQVIVINGALGMRKGKIAAQVAHASMKVFFNMLSVDKQCCEPSHWNDGFHDSAHGDPYEHNANCSYRMFGFINGPMAHWATHSFKKIVSYSKISEQDKYNRTRNMGVLSHTNIRFDGIQNMRYWINHLQTVHVNDSHTISEFETFVRFPNGTFRKRNDNFYDDRVMALVWALFILEDEICQQYFQIVEHDMQHKPMHIKDNGYWEKIEQFYELKELSKFAKIIPKPINLNKEPVFETLNVTTEDMNTINKYEEDLEELLAQGYEFL